MARPPERAETLKKVWEYLRQAETHPPDQMPINFSAVAKGTGLDRRTVRKHASAEIEAAQKAQAREQMSPRRREEEAYQDKIREKDEEVAVWRKKYENMLERAFLIEANAKRLGIDPDEFYRPIELPDRSVSRAGRGRGKKRG